MPDDDVREENPNLHYRVSLTIWGKTCSAQMRDGQLAVHHYDDAPRSTEDGEPYLLPVFDAVLLRDLLVAATERSYLPEPATVVQATPHPLGLPDDFKQED